MSSKKALVNTTDFFFIEVNTDMGKKLNEAKEAITPPIAKKNIDTINKTEKSQAPPPPKDKSSSNKTDKGK